MSFTVKRESRPGTIAGWLDNRKSEIDNVVVDRHIGAFDPEAYDAEAFDVSFDILDRRITKA